MVCDEHTFNTPSLHPVSPSNIFIMPSMSRVFEHPPPGKSGCNSSAASDSTLDSSFQLFRTPGSFMKRQPSAIPRCRYSFAPCFFRQLPDPENKTYCIRMQRRNRTNGQARQTLLHLDVFDFLHWSQSFLENKRCCHNDERALAKLTGSMPISIRRTIVSIALFVECTKIRCPVKEASGCRFAVSASPSHPFLFIGCNTGKERSTSAKVRPILLWV